VPECVNPSRSSPGVIGVQQQSAVKPWSLEAPHPLAMCGIGSIGQADRSPFPCVRPFRLACQTAPFVGASNDPLPWPRRSAHLMPRPTRFDFRVSDRPWQRFFSDRVSATNPGAPRVSRSPTTKFDPPNGRRVLVAGRIRPGPALKTSTRCLWIIGNDLARPQC